MTLLPGRKYAGMAGKHWRDLESNAAALRDVEGVDTASLERARVRDMAAVMEGHGIELLRHPIVDSGVPHDRAAFATLLADLADRLRAGQIVAVACMGGLGRTGITVACLLIGERLDAESAIALTRADAARRDREGQAGGVREAVGSARRRATLRAQSVPSKLARWRATQVP